jgi:hypothetical protein
MIYKAPKQIDYQGNIYKVDSSANNIMKIQEYFLDDDIPEQMKGIILVKRMFGKEAPFTQTLIDLAVEIIMLGKVNEENNRNESGICLFEDYEVYRMEILRDTGIDIKNVNVEWEFIINAISEFKKDCKLYEMAYYRTVDLSKIKDKDERKRAKALKEEYKFKKDIQKEQELINRKNDTLERWGLERR